MTDNTIFESLGKMTEEMYLGLAKTQSAEMQDQLVAYHAVAEGKITELISKMSECVAGELLKEQQRKIQILSDDFSELKKDIGGRYKIYLRGCGKAGKSTLLNALLSIDENTGSRMGRIPMTFTIDTYTDDLKVNEAEVKIIDAKGKGKVLHVTRDKAIAMELTEEENFNKSKEKCEELIKDRVKDVYLEQEREDIETDVYKQNLMKTTIREIKWGIGSNNFFHNCVLIDTPGLSQELRFTNVIEDVKNYELDGIVWVISSDTLAKMEVIEAYQKEFKELESVYAGKKVIAVINMYGLSPDYSYGSRLWKRVEKRAKEIYSRKYGFDELICVNAKMAYEGNINQNQQQIDSSNISELRKKINEMFIEKSSEEYHNAKLNKIDSFLNNLYRIVSDQRLELNNRISKYNDKSAKITSQKSACTMLFSREKDKIVSQHMANVKNRIDKNISRINDLDNESDVSRRYFIEDNIIYVNELEKKLYDTVEKCDELVFRRFKEQQIQSIISGFKSETFALQSLGKYASDFSISKKRKGIRISAPSGFGAGVYNFVTEAFGKKSIVSSIVKGIRDSIKSPKDRIYEEIRRDIRKWTDSISLSEEIDEYEKQCRDTLDKSMEFTCGNHESIRRLSEYMEEFINCQPHLEWEKVSLFEIIGGTEHV